MRGARVEYTIDSSEDLPPGLSLGRGGRKLGSGDKQEPKAPLGIDQKVERDTDSMMTERDNAESISVTEKAPTPGGTEDWGNYQNWYNYTNYQNWLRVNNWGGKYRCRHEKRVVLINGEIKTR